jgi:hypothetical protein
MQSISVTFAVRLTASAGRREKSHRRFSRKCRAFPLPSRDAYIVLARTEVVKLGCMKDKWRGMGIHNYTHGVLTMDDKPRFAGHKLIEFSPTARQTLQEVAERLIPHEKSIVDGWVSRQFETWQPPGFSPESLGEIFGEIVGCVLHCMKSGELEVCIENLEQAGGRLAVRQFPFDALVISVHFFEETYLPFLLDPPPPHPGHWLVTIDEFLHVALAAISNAYFETHRSELLDFAEVGRTVQESLLARIPRRISDLEVAYVYISARDRAQLGGDFLDYFRIRHGADIFLIGDLSGHGLEAAAESLTLRSLFRGFMREQPDLPNAMQRLNRVICQELRSGHFATALAMSYDGKGHLRLVNAGHPFPVLCGEQPDIHGMALAIQEESAYEAQDLDLPRGGLFVAYTDGLVEARSKGEIFGEDRLIQTIVEMHDASPSAIVGRLVDDAQRHAGGRFSDDVAVLVLRRRAGSPDYARPA